MSVPDMKKTITMFGLIFLLCMNAHAKNISTISPPLSPTGAKIYGESASREPGYLPYDQDGFATVNSITELGAQITSLCQDKITVRIPKGSYTQTTTADFSECNVVGAGSDTVITFTGTGSAFMTQGVTHNSSRLRSVKIIANEDATDHVVKIQDGSNDLVEDCEITLGPVNYAAIAILGTGLGVGQGGSDMHAHKAMNNNLHDNLGSGVYWGGPGGGEAATYSGNYIYNNNQWGAILEYGIQNYRVPLTAAITAGANTIAYSGAPNLANGDTINITNNSDTIESFTVSDVTGTTATLSGNLVGAVASTNLVTVTDKWFLDQVSSVSFNGNYVISNAAGQLKLDSIFGGIVTGNALNNPPSATTPPVVINPGHNPEKTQTAGLTRGLVLQSNMIGAGQSLTAIDMTRLDGMQVDYIKSSIIGPNFFSAGMISNSQFAYVRYTNLGNVSFNVPDCSKIFQIDTGNSSNVSCRDELGVNWVTSPKNLAAAMPVMGVATTNPGTSFSTGNVGAFTVESAPLPDVSNFYSNNNTSGGFVTGTLYEVAWSYIDATGGESPMSTFYQSSNGETTTNNTTMRVSIPAYPLPVADAVSFKFYCKITAANTAPTLCGTQANDGTTGLNLTAPGTTTYPAKTSAYAAKLAKDGVLLPKFTVATLGTAPRAGLAVYCSDCTTAATCEGSGSGHMAVSNGSAWTCQ